MDRLRSRSSIATAIRQSSRPPASPSRQPPRSRSMPARLRSRPGSSPSTPACRGSPALCRPTPSSATASFRRPTRPAPEISGEAMTAHPIQWHAPKPLWARFGAIPRSAVRAPDQFRPAILRFATDDFMDQIIGTLGRDPARLGDFLARPETWRTPMMTAEPDLAERVVVPAIAQAAARSRALARPGSRLEPVAATSQVTERSQTRALPLKLYQAAHMRHYLVS